MSARAGVSALQKVGNLLYAARPAATALASSSAPCAVVLYGWMDAELKYVAKYALPYTEMYPNATVLVQLSTTGSAFMTSMPGGKPDTLAALQLLREAHDRARTSTPDRRPTVVFHSFSNGGLMPLTSLLECGRAEPERLPQPAAYIMDCSPGYLDGNGFARAMASMAPSSSLSEQLRHWATRNATRTYFNGVNALAEFWNRENPLERAKRELNEVSTWAWGPTPAQLPARLYTYTAADRFISPEAVRAHAEQAQATMGPRPLCVHSMEGVAAKDVRMTDDRVQLCEWTSPKHCAIARDAPHTYWAAVGEFLERILTSSDVRKAKY